MSKVRLAYAGLIGAALLQSLYFYPKLPATIASHYSARGAADGWPHGRRSSAATP